MPGSWWRTRQGSSAKDFFMQGSSKILYFRRHFKSTFVSNCPPFYDVIMKRPVFFLIHTQEAADLKIRIPIAICFPQKVVHDTIKGCVLPPKFYISYISYIGEKNSYIPIQEAQKAPEFSRYTKGWRPQLPISLYFLCSKTWTRKPDHKKI